MFSDGTHLLSLDSKTSIIYKCELETWTIFVIYHVFGCTLKVLSLLPNYNVIIAQ